MPLVLAIACRYGLGKRQDLGIRMFYTTDTNDHGLRYNPFKAIVSPRPIAWISSQDSNGRRNLAPYSFFNGMSDEPPMIGFGSGATKIGLDERKDSLANIRETGVFCVNIVSDALKHKMNQSSGSYLQDEDEFEITGLTPTIGTTVAAPFVAEAPISLECKVHDIIPLPGTSTWVMGVVTAVHIKDEFIVEGKLDVTNISTSFPLGVQRLRDGLRSL